MLTSDSSFDALVTDYAMPGLNGANLIVEAQAITPEMPSLIITGFAEVNKLSTLPKTVRILEKPFRREALLVAMGQMLTGQGGDGLPQLPQSGPAKQERNNKINDLSQVNILISIKLREPCQ